MLDNITEDTSAPQDDEVWLIYKTGPDIEDTLLTITRTSYLAKRWAKANLDSLLEWRGDIGTLNIKIEKRKVVI